MSSLPSGWLPVGDSRGDRVTEARLLTFASRFGLYPDEALEPLAHEFLFFTEDYGTRVILGGDPLEDPEHLVVSSWFTQSGDSSSDSRIFSWRGIRILLMSDGMQYSQLAVEQT